MIARPDPNTSSAVEAPAAAAPADAAAAPADAAAAAPADAAAIYSAHAGNSRPSGRLFYLCAIQIHRRYFDTSVKNSLMQR